MSEMLAQGTKIGIKIGEVFVEIDPKSFTGPGGAASMIDATTLQSTAKRKRIGLADNGQMSMALNFDPTNTAHIALQTAKATKARQLFELEFEDGTVWAYGGYVSTFTPSGAVDGLVDIACSIEIDGDIVSTAPV